MIENCNGSVCCPPISRCIHFDALFIIPYRLSIPSYGMEHRLALKSYKFEMEDEPTLSNLHQIEGNSIFLPEQTMNTP